MKKTIFTLFVLFLNVFTFFKPTLAEDNLLNEHGPTEQKGYKDECLLLAVNCGTEFLTLEQKIDKLESEISKGRSVYSDDELKILKEQLDNANKTLNYFKSDGASNLIKYPGEW